MRVLIWNNFKLENKGGPPGYLFNLNNYFKNVTKIKFLNYYKEDKVIYKKSINQGLKKIEIIRVLYLMLLLKKKHKLKININEYDLIHFHSTEEFYKNSFLPIKAKAIKVLTSHSPQLSTQEHIDNLNLKQKILKKFCFRFLKKIDIYSFENADYLIFPCNEAMEPYFNSNKEIKKILERKLNENRVKFLPTGIIDKKIEFQKDYFYKNFSIPKNAIVLCYIGRHNEIKGYDFLVEAAKDLLDKNPNIYIIVAGQMNPNISALKHERWIELGWTQEGDNIMKHAHAYLLPNRETYFDLVFIEALRAGTTIICSETGGNKYFKRFNSQEIIYFEKENKNNFIRVVEQNLNRFEEENYIKNRKENRKIYENNFTVDIFGDNYLKLMEDIYEENKKFKK